MSNQDEKEKLNNNNKNNSSDDEDNIGNEKNFKNEEDLKKVFKLKKDSEEKAKIKTNEVEDFLIIKEKIQKLRNMKFDANDLLKKEKYEEAINKYKETINTLLEEIVKLTIDMNILDSLKEEIIIPCYQNIALCNMKLKKWIKVKTYSKKALALNKDNVKAAYRLCYANIKLGHLKKADHQLEDLEKLIGGTPELEELEKIYEINKLNSEGNNGEFLKRMGRKLRDGKINMYSDKKSEIKIEKEKTSEGFMTKIKNMLGFICRCCRKKKIKKKIKKK